MPFAAVCSQGFNSLLGLLSDRYLPLDAFALAREIQVVGMRASPYDVTSYGLTPIAIETPEGKAEYVRRQREFAVRSAEVRVRLLAVCESLLG